MSLLIFKTVCEKIIEYFIYNSISGKPNEETFWHYQGIKTKIFISSMFKFLPTVSSVQSILINNSVDLGGALIVFQGSSCPIIKHKQIIIRCLLSNEIIQVLIQEFVTSMASNHLWQSCLSFYRTNIEEHIFKGYFLLNSTL